MKFKNTLVMALVLGAIASYYFFIDIPQEKKKKEEKKRAEKIFQFDKDHVQSITLAKKDQTIKILKKDGKWKVDKPLQVDTDTDAAEFLVTALKNARFTRVVDDNPTDLATFGLKDPQLKITLLVKDKKKQTLRIGDDAPIGSFLYVQREDETKVLLCPTDRKDLNKTLFDLRDKTILSVSTEEVIHADLSSPKGVIHLIQNDQKWTVEGKDLLGQADASGITSMLSTLNQAQVKAFVEEQPNNLKPYGLDSPNLKLTLTSKEGQKILLDGQPATEGTHYAKTGHGQNIFTIADSLIELFSLKPLDYLSKTLIELEGKQVKSLTLVTEETEIQLNRNSMKSESWRITTPIETAADTATVNSLLFDLKDTRITQYVQSSVNNLKPFGLDSPKKFLKAEIQDGKSFSFNLGNITDDGNKIFSNRTGETHVFLLESEDVEKIFRSLHDLRDKKLLSVKTDAVQKIRLQYLEKIFELTKQGNSWSLVQPVSIENIKEFIASDILWTLKNLEFSSIIDPPPEPKSTGLDKPYLTLRLWGENDKNLGTLQVGKPSPPDKHLFVQVQGHSKLYQIQERFLTEIPSTLEKFKS